MGIRMRRHVTKAATALTLAAGLAPGNLLACAACYGQSDSPMAAGMNWGIFSLLGVIGMVLLGVAGFGVFLARKAASVRSSAMDPNLETAPLPNK